MISTEQQGRVIRGQTTAVRQDPSGEGTSPRYLRSKSGSTTQRNRPVPPPIPAAVEEPSRHAQQLAAIARRRVWPLNPTTLDVRLLRDSWLQCTSGSAEATPANIRRRRASTKGQNCIAAAALRIVSRASCFTCIHVFCVTMNAPRPHQFYWSSFCCSFKKRLKMTCHVLNNSA